MSRVLAVNCGSSSLKYAQYDGEREVRRGSIEHIGADGGPATHAAAVAAVFDLLKRAGLAAPTAVGHRVVHGGPEHSWPALADHNVMTSLERAVPFAPLHLPAELAAIRAVRTYYGDIPQVVAFDTGFHRTMPVLAQRLPLTRALYDAGVRRYGFHGLSYEYVVETLRPANLKRAIIAHLGSGASMVATKDGIAVDTTMGFTPTAGLVMGTRTGDLDPGLIVYLLANGYDAARLELAVNHEGGLRALSETTGDMQKLLALEATDARATFAIDVFCYHARRWIGALTATLGGIDTLVFTGGIGENAAKIRARICVGLQYLGITLDGERNERATSIISRAGATCRVQVVRTDEECMVARHTRLLVG